ncbi:H(+)-transporting V1 sector ATPase subunit H [Cystobasidiomycetes sp. EMM_F5]
MASSRKLDIAGDKLRARQIGWEGYSRAGDLSQDQLQSVLRLAKQPKQSTDQILSQSPSAYAALFVKLLASINRTDAQQWALVMLGDLVLGHDDHSVVLEAQPWDALCRQLDSSDEFCQLKAAVIVSLLLPVDSSAPSKAANKLTRVLGSFLRQSADNQDIALQCLGEVLRSHTIRLAVWNSEASDKGKGQAQAGDGKIIEGLTNMLKSIINANTPVSPQVQYQIVFCFWLFSFEQVVCDGIEGKFGVIALLSDVARRAVKEKVVRVILSLFRNLLTLSPNANKSSLLMPSSGILQFTQSLMTSKRFFGDDEIRDDTEWLRDFLKAASRELTTWDQYVAEVNSKHLAWSPVHTDDEFWSSNASKLSLSAGSNQGVLNKLVALLDQEEGRPPSTYAIVCSDLVMFIKYHELGKRDVQKLGAKPKVLQLLSHSDPDVRYRALVVVQLLQLIASLPLLCSFLIIKHRYYKSPRSLQPTFSSETHIRSYRTRNPKHNDKSLLPLPSPTPNGNMRTSILVASSVIASAYARPFAGLWSSGDAPENNNLPVVKVDSTTHANVLPATADAKVCAKVDLNLPNADVDCHDGDQPTAALQVPDNDSESQHDKDEIKKLQQQLDDTRAQIDDLTKKLQDTQNDENTLADLRIKLLAALNLDADLTKQLQADKDSLASVDDLHHKLDWSTSQIDDLKKQLESAKADSATLVNVKAELQAALADKDDLSKKLAAALSHSDDLAKQLDARTHECDRENLRATVSAPVKAVENNEKQTAQTSSEDVHQDVKQNTQQGKQLGQDIANGASNTVSNAKEIHLNADADHSN